MLSEHALLGMTRSGWFWAFYIARSAEKSRRLVEALLSIGGALDLDGATHSITNLRRQERLAAHATNSALAATWTASPRRKSRRR